MTAALNELPQAPKRVKSSDALRNVKITDEEILQYDLLIKRLINEQILRFWAKGHTVKSLDPEVTIGRLGMSVNDLMQIGRLHALHQLRFLKLNYDPQKSLHLTMMFTYLRNKFQSLSRVQTNGKHGGGIIAMDEQRLILQTFVEKVHSTPEMTLSECEALLNETLADVNREIQRQVKVGLYSKGKFNHKLMKTASDIAKHVESKLVHMEVVHVMSFEDVRHGQHGKENDNMHSNFEGIDYETPESLLLSKEYLEKEMNDGTKNNEPVAATTAAVEEAVVLTATVPTEAAAAVSTKTRRTNKKSGNLRIFKLAKEKGLPEKHADLAALLGKRPSAFSNIIHGGSDGNAAFRAKLAEIFPGESLEDLRKPVESEG